MNDENKIPASIEQTAFEPNNIADEGFYVSDFVINPEPRMPCLLLLDTSRSMGGEPIRELNEGLKAYRDDILIDDLAAKRIEVSVVTFGGEPKVVHEFSTIQEFKPPELKVNGDTPMGAAINFAIDHVENRKKIYRDNGIAFYRPWIFLITDGGPTDEWHEAAEKVKDAEEARKLSFFAVGVGSRVKMDILEKISIKTRRPLRLQGLKFTTLFQWLSTSQKTISMSRPGEEGGIKFSPIQGWANLG